MFSNTAQRGEAAPDDVKAGVLRLCSKLGTEAAAKELGICRTTLARVVGGLPVYPPTLVKCRKALEAGAQ